MELEMVADYAFVLLALLLLFIIYYIMNKDTQYTKQIRSIATAVEQLRKDLYQSEKKVMQHLAELHALSSDNLTGEDPFKSVNKEIKKVIDPIAQNLYEIEENVSGFQENMEERVNKLESNLKKLALPGSINNVDDDKIIALYKQGVDIDSIARELHLAKAEVEFTLKLHKIK